MKGERWRISSIRPSEQWSQSRDYDLITFARGWQKVTGVFNSHSPRRPNGIGVDIVELVSVEDGELLIEGGDMLPGTPILDIKPVMPEK